MWELIRANNRKSIVLFVALALCLLGLGYLLGAAFFPPNGGVTGLLVAAAIWLVMCLISLTSADSIFLSISHAVPITHDVHPQLFNIVEEMKIAANLPAMPKIYIIHDPAPNAFATGIDINNSSVVVTTGLLEKLTRDELQGVMAHEIGHIINRDVKFITLAGVMLGSIALVSEVFLRGMRYSSVSSRRYSSRSSSRDGQGQVVLMIIAILFAILAPLLAQIFYFAISRKREYLADATAARLTRYPEGLASALEKISSSPETLSTANKITAPMYIVNPLRSEGMALTGLLSTHPPTEERIKILRSIMGGANYADYQQAYARFKGRAAPLIPASGLSDKTKIFIREAAAEPPKSPSPLASHDAGDLLRAANGFAFVACVCGLKFKIPPELTQSPVECPRCLRRIAVPKVLENVLDKTVLGDMLTTTQILTGVEKLSTPQRPRASRDSTFARKSKSWESVQCACGQLLQISPLFAGTHMRCPKCRATVHVTSEAG